MILGPQKDFFPLSFEKIFFFFFKESVSAWKTSVMIYIFL